MPVFCEFPMRSISSSEFNRIDRIVMACAYESHNHFGRLCEEEVYENDLKKRLLASGLSDAQTQIEVRVTHGDFEKIYRLDLLAGSMLYELKAVSGLNSAHETQALNYAALLKLSRVKLINFGGLRVAGKLLATPFEKIDRTEVNFHKSHWRPLTPACQKLADQFEELIRDIGGYLEGRIYDEAMIYLFGGKIACLKRLPILRGSTELGHHLCRVYTEDAAFIISTEGNAERRANFHKQLQSLLRALPIHIFQWINVHHNRVTFTTLESPKA